MKLKKRYTQTLSWAESDFPLVTRACQQARQNQRAARAQGEVTASISEVILSLAEAQLEHQESLPTHESLERVESAIMEMLKLMRQGVHFERASQQVIETQEDGLSRAEMARLTKALTGI